MENSWRIELGLQWKSVATGSGCLVWEKMRFDAAAMHIGGGHIAGIVGEDRHGIEIGRRHDPEQKVDEAPLLGGPVSKSIQSSGQWRATASITWCGTAP